MRALVLVLVFALSGCADLAGLVGVDTTYTAPFLGTAPGPSGCEEARCLELDRLEATLYAGARSGRIRWSQLVDTFYSRRAQLFPDSDDSSIRELISYQRVLAEQLDAKRITEAQWTYAQEKKIADMRARTELIQNTRHRPTNCVTRNVGTTISPEYRTECN
jgi:hypothetical protein